METDRPRIRANQQHRDKNIGGPVRIRPTIRSKIEPPTEHQVYVRDRYTHRDGVEGSAGTLQEILQEEDIMPRGRLQHSHLKKQQKKMSKEIKTLKQRSLDSVLPQPYPAYNRRSQHHPQRHSIFNKPITNKTQKKFEKHRRRWEQNKKIRQDPASNVHNHAQHKRSQPRTTICQPIDTYKHTDRGAIAPPPDPNKSYKTTKKAHKKGPAKNKEHEKHRQESEKDVFNHIQNQCETCPKAKKLLDPANSKKKNTEAAIMAIVPIKNVKAT
jgi:hypothetical protein